MLVQVLSNRFDLIAPYIDDEEVEFVLLQNGVYLVPQILATISSNRVKVLNTDWLASGLTEHLTENDLPKDKHVQTINHTQWVSLCAEHHAVITVQ